MKEINIYWQDTISKRIATIEFPADADQEAINEAVEGALMEWDGGRGLCYSCTKEVGELSGSGSFTADDEDGNTVYDDTYTSRLERKIAALEAELKALKGQ